MWGVYLYSDWYRYYTPYPLTLLLHVLRIVQLTLFRLRTLTPVQGPRVGWGPEVSETTVSVKVLNFFIPCTNLTGYNGRLLLVSDLSVIRIDWRFRRKGNETPFRE